MALYIESSFRRDFFSSFWDEGSQVGGHVAADRDDVFVGGQLEVKLSLYRVGEEVHVTFLDMSAVLAEVKYNSVCPGLLTTCSGPNGIGERLLSGISKRSDVVNVNKKINHGKSEERHRG